MSTKLLTDGCWTWFNHPVASVCTDGSLLIGAWPATLGRPVVAKYDATGKKDITSLMPTGATSYENDDHDNPAMLELASGKVLACFSYHNGDSFSLTSANNYDVRSWNSIVTVNTASDDAYVQLMQAGNSANTIYWFFRRTSSGSYRPQYFRTSTDDGATWSSATEFANYASNRPYFRWWKTSATRFDWSCTQGHPNEATGNSIYHGYMTIDSGGTRAYFKSDGTSLGADADLPFDVVADFTQVYDGTTNESWIWDIKHISGQPAVVFAVFVGGSSVHEYHRGTFNGSTWTTEKIADAGTTGTDYLYAAEPYYSGGVCLDPLSEDIVYLSKKYGTSDFRVEKWEKSGGTWSKTADLSGNTSSINARPVAVAVGGVTQVLWWSGTYTSYSSYSTDVYVSPNASFRTAKLATPSARNLYLPAASQLILPLQDASGNPADLLSNYTVTQQGTVTRTNDSFGYYASGWSTSNYFALNALAAAWVAGAFPKWLVVLFSNTSTTTGQYLIGLGRSSTNTPIVGLSINDVVSGTCAYVQRDDANVSHIASGASLACNDGNIHMAMGISTSASAHRFFFDGVQRTDDNTTVGTTTVDRAAIGALVRSTVGSAFQGKIYAVGAGWGGFPHFGDLYDDWISGRFSGMQATGSGAVRRRRLLLRG